MAKVIMCAKVFPKGHINEGEPTYFRWKIAQGIKIHTIRKGHRWKEGDEVSLRKWEGLPYKSKQKGIATAWVHKLYSIKINEQGTVILNDLIIGNFLALNTQIALEYPVLASLIANDGLTIDEFRSWFENSLPFDGQVICWRDPEYKIEHII